MTDKTPKPVTAKRGKIKGTATVTPKAEKEGADAQREPPEPTGAATGGDRLLSQAYEEGRLASQRGTPSKPPLGYTQNEIKAWHEGYKSHANPRSEGTVEGISHGYRKDY